MRILFFNKSIDYAGAAKMMAFVANSASNNNHEVSILLFSNNKIEQKLNEDIKIIYKKNDAPGFFNHIKNIINLKKIIKECNPDVIVSFLIIPNFYASIIGYILGIPVIISERGDPYSYIKKGGRKGKVIHKSYNLASGAVFQTNGAKEFFSKKLQKRSCVIPNPVVRKNNGIKFNSYTENHEIVFVARFQNAQKRQDLMIEALEKVIVTYPDTLLKFYGTGEDQAMIENLVQDKGLENNVRFMGYTNSPEEVMVNSEVFVLTSDYEGIPNSLIEAMSVGMPVVSTDCDPGGARMLIKDGVNGMLVKKNDAQGIADAIINIFSDKNLRLRLSEEAYKITETFSEDKIAKLWIEYITSIAKK